MKITHIKLNIFGDNSVKGWWVHNNFPKIHKYVVIECNRLTTNRYDEEASFLIKLGAKTVQLIENK